MEPKVQVVKTLKDGVAVNVKVEAETHEEAYDKVVAKTLESIANQTFYHERVIVFDADLNPREFAPNFESTGIIE